MPVPEHPPKLLHKANKTHLPKVLIRSQQLPIRAKHRKAHAVRVRLEHLVPAPEHVAVHVVCDVVLPTEHQALRLEDGRVARGDRARVDRLWV